MRSAWTDQPAYPQSLIRVYTGRKYNLWTIKILLANSIDPDKTLRLHSLIRVCAGCVGHRVDFYSEGSYLEPVWIYVCCRIKLQIKSEYILGAFKCC